MVLEAGLSITVVVLSIALTCACASRKLWMDDARALEERLKESREERDRVYDQLDTERKRYSELRSGINAFTSSR